MKTLKCPLCGNEMQLQSDVYDEDLYTGYYTRMYYYECINCPLATTPVDSAQRAEHQIKDLVSKFPPIMRLKPGDLIKIRKLPDNFFVIKTDVEKGVIRAGSTYEYSMSYAPEDVEQWPWEIKQKEN
jgi:hypothetical protein